MNLLFILWTFEPKCKNSGVLNSRTCNQIHHNHQGNLLPFWNYLEFLDNFQIFFHWTFVQNNRSDHTKKHWKTKSNAKSCMFWFQNCKNTHICSSCTAKFHITYFKNKIFINIKKDTLCTGDNITQNEYTQPYSIWLHYQKLKTLVKDSLFFFSGWNMILIIEDCVIQIKNDVWLMWVQCLCQKMN